MKAFLTKRLLRRITHRVLLILVIAQVLSGLGMLYPQVIETISLGILTKAIAYKIHFYLIIPFILTLIAHIFFGLNKGENKR